MLTLIPYRQKHSSPDILKRVKSYRIFYKLYTLNYTLTKMAIQKSEGSGDLGTGGVLKEGLSGNIHSVQFATLKKELSENTSQDLSLFRDVALDVRAELGRSKKRVRDILDIKKGSIIKLDTLVGEPVNIVVNGRLIAKGGVVIVNESLGVRITEITEPVYESLR